MAKNGGGRFIRFDEPLAKTAADKTMSWFYMLHIAKVFGLPYRIFVASLGVAVAALNLTGVFIWMKKRSAKLLGKQRAAQSKITTRRGGIPAK